jgi:hypothetical protein
VKDDACIDEAIAAQAREPGGGLINLPESFSFIHRDAIIAAAIRHRLPLIESGRGIRSGWRTDGLLVRHGRPISTSRVPRADHGAGVPGADNG